MSIHKERLKHFRAIKLTHRTHQESLQITELTRRLKTLEEAAKLNQQLSSPIIGTIRSFGWWGGALGLSEALKGITWITIPAVREVPMITAIQGSTSWILGCALGAGFVERLVTPLGIRLSKLRENTNKEST